MDRKEFLKYLAATGGILAMTSFDKIGEMFDEQDTVMPVLFMGHGSPMNAIENNLFSQKWASLGKEIGTPKAVLCISAHWLSSGTHVTAMDTPRTIHDFGGFPKALFDVQYPAPGDPLLAADLVKMVKKTQVGLNHDWGLDHGTWSVVRQMYPDAKVPVLQMSIDYRQPMQYHYDLAKELADLRKKGVLIIGSGNMIHNLGMVAWDKMNEDNYGYDWAIEFNDLLKQHISNKNHAALIQYPSLSKAAMLAIPTPDHYIPMLYALSLQDNLDNLSFFNDKLVAGSLNMTSFMLSRNTIINTPKLDPSSSDSSSTDSTATGA